MKLRWNTGTAWTVKVDRRQQGRAQGGETLICLAQIGDTPPNQTVTIQREWRTPVGRVVAAPNLDHAPANTPCSLWGRLIGLVYGSVTRPQETFWTRATGVRSQRLRGFVQRVAEH
jgi:hypothetical protein